MKGDLGFEEHVPPTWPWRPVVLRSGVAQDARDEASTSSITFSSVSKKRVGRRVYLHTLLHRSRGVASTVVLCHVLGPP